MALRFIIRWSVNRTRPPDPFNRHKNGIEPEEEKIHVILHAPLMLGKIPRNADRGDMMLPPQQ